MQTVQTQIRLLLQEQSDQGLHCLQFQLQLLDIFTVLLKKTDPFEDSYMYIFMQGVEN